MDRDRHRQPSEKPSCALGAPPHALTLATAIIESTNLAVVTTDCDGTITSWNRGAEELYGYSAQEMIGRSAFALGASPGEGEQMRERLRRVLAGEHFSEHMPQRHRDGRVIHVALSGSPLRDAAGEIVGTTAIARDVSDEHYLSRRLAAAEERQRLLLGSLPDTMIALYDRDLRCMMIDGPALTQSGLDPSDYVGRPLSDTLPPDQHEQLAPLITRALAGESGSKRYVSRLTGLTYELDVEPYRQADGTIAGALAVGRNITDRLAREQELRRLADIVEQSGEAITSKNAAGVITGWNDAAARLYGYAAHEALGEPITMLIPEHRRGEEQTLLARALGGETVKQLITERVRRDGTIFDASITVSPLRDASGRPVGASVITRDISSSVQVRREREAALQHLADH